MGTTGAAPTGARHHGSATGEGTAMSDGEMNLRVVTEHLLHLSEKQSRAADKLIGANRAVSGVAEAVASTHGVACSLTNQAVTEAVSRRAAAGENLRKVSTELDEKLKSAAGNYANADYMAGKSIDNECSM